MSTELGSAMMEFSETMKPIHDFIDGQREDFKRRGYSETATEQMAVALYNHVLHMIRTAK